MEKTDTKTIIEWDLQHSFFYKDDMSSQIILKHGLKKKGTKNTGMVENSQLTTVAQKEPTLLLSEKPIINH